jgi:ABC-type branched-subunit amino acid transport system ATPase component
LRVLMGLIRPARGRIWFDGREITRLDPYKISNLGLAYVPQGREIFDDFTVEQNLLLGVIGKKDIPFEVPEHLFSFFPVLAERLGQKAGSFSGGQQQQLAIARALAGRPRMLLLDEPSEGIQPNIVEQISTALRDIAREEGISVLLVEQNVEMVLDTATSCLFMENGHIVERQGVEAIRADEKILDRYLAV